MSKIFLCQFEVAGTGKPRPVVYKSLESVQSIEFLFENHAELITGAPENVFYALAYAENFRDHLYQNVVPFDIDNILWSDDKYFTGEQVVRASCAAIGVEYEKCASVVTGNGVQFLVRVDEKFTKEGFPKFRDQYRALCDKINLALETLGMGGKADPTGWAPNKLFRAPGTINQKPKGRTECFALNTSLAVQENPLGKPGTSDYLSERETGLMPRTLDEQEISTKCAVFSTLKARAHEIDEPEYYAALSILGRFEEPEKSALEFFEGRIGSGRKNGNTSEEILDKMRQALSASGPRTCESFRRVSEKCAGCRLNVKSPALIQGSEFVATKDSGFYFIKISENGAVTRKPDKQGLKKHLIKQKNLKVVGGAVYTFTGTHYRPMQRDELITLINNSFKPEPDNHQINLEVYNLIKDTAYSGFDVRSAHATTNGFLNMRNGILEMKTKTLRPHNKDFFFEYVLPYDYIPGATAPKFEKFLSEITENDPEKILLIKQFMGFIVSDEDPADFEKCLVLTGPAGTGKSKLSDIMKGMVGENNISHVSLAHFGTDTKAMQMQGKLMNLSEETPTDALRKNLDVFKKAVSGQILSGKRLYENIVEFQLRAKLVFLCNELPSNSDHSEAALRRMILMPIEKIYWNTADKDSNVAKRIVAEEMPGVFNVVTEEFFKIRDKTTFTIPKDSERLAHEYRLDNDHLLTFINERTEAVGEGEYLSKLYTEYRDHAEFTHHIDKRFILNLRNFAKRMRMQFGKAIVKKNKGVFLEGISLRKENKDDF